MGKMNEVYDKMKLLQDVLLQEFAVEQELDEIPQELNSLKTKFERLGKSINENKINKENYTKNVEELDKTIFQLTGDKERYENQILQIKTQKEYEALTSEIAQIDDKLSMMKEEASDTRQEIEKLEKLLEAQNSQYEELDEKIAQSENEVNAALAEKNKELKKYLKEKKKITSGLDEEVIYKFEKIVKKKDGLGIVSIKNNVCMGCNMILPPQFVNDVRREEEIIFCPNCSRILYYYEEEKEDSPIAAV